MGVLGGRPQALAGNGRGPQLQRAVTRGRRLQHVAAIGLRLRLQAAALKQVLQGFLFSEAAVEPRAALAAGQVVVPGEEHPGLLGVVIERTDQRTRGNAVLAMAAGLFAAGGISRLGGHRGQAQQGSGKGQCQGAQGKTKTGGDVVRHGGPFGSSRSAIEVLLGVNRTKNAKGNRDLKKIWFWRLLRLWLRR
ncbi:hypothetical protein D3C84_340640 [compost metagenome]